MGKLEEHYDILTGEMAALSIGTPTVEKLLTCTQAFRMP